MMQGMNMVTSTATAAYWWQHVALKDKDNLQSALQDMSAKEFTRIQGILGAKEMDKTKAVDEWATIMDGIEAPKSEEAAKMSPDKGKKKSGKKDKKSGGKKDKKPKKEKKAKVEKKPKENIPSMPPLPEPKGIKLTVNPDLFAVIPRPNTEDYEAIKLDIEENGLNEPMKVYEREGKYVVWEGHTRLQALIELGVEITKDHFVVQEVSDEEIVDRIISCNVSRRHLTGAQKIAIYKRHKPDVLAEIEVRVKNKRAEKFKASKQASDAKKDKKDKKGKDTPTESGGQEPTPTARSLKAQEIGVSETELRYYEYLEKWNPDNLKKEIEKGKDAKLYPLYQSTVEMEQYVKTHDPGAHKQLKEDPSKLVEVYNELVAKFGTERKAGPLETLVVELQAAYERLIIKEHGALDFEKMTQFQKEYWGILERKKETYAKSSK